MHKILKILLFFIALNQLSCKEKNENNLPGIWQIQKYTYNEQPLTTNFYSNVIIIHKDSIIELPINNWENRHSNKEKGCWKFNKNDNILFINTTNELFNGKYEIKKIWRTHDENGGGNFINMEISSSFITIQCRKDENDDGF